MSSSNSPMLLNFDGAFAPSTISSQNVNVQKCGDLLAPPAFERPDTPIRGRERFRTTETAPEEVPYKPTATKSKDGLKCADCSGDELCPLHDFISEEPKDSSTPSDLEQLPSKPARSSLASRRDQRPKLRLKTPGKVQERQIQASSITAESRSVSLKQSDIRRHATRDTTGSSPASGSTLLGSGSTPGSGSKKWAKQRVSFAVNPVDEARSDSREPLRPYLPRGSSNRSSKGSPSPQSGSQKSEKKRRLFFFQRYPSSTASSVRSQRDTDWMARRDTPVHTPVQLPRRISRLPSFFTRERLILPERVQRRDVMLLSLSIVMAIIFITIAIVAATRPDKVCSVHWLAVTIDSFLPNLAISTPYTFLVVGFAVSQAGRKWINGRYTPLLYALTVALGRVAVGALSGNITWKVFNCAWGGA